MIKKLKVMASSVVIAAVMLLGFASAPAFAANCDATQGIKTSVECVNGSKPKDLFGNGSLFQTISNTALFLIGAISVIMLIYGGIRYTISGGDSKNVTAAKDTILYAIVGIVVALLAAAIVNFVITRLSA